MQIAIENGVTNDKVFITRSCDKCQFAELFLVKA